MTPSAQTACRAFHGTKAPHGGWAACPCGAAPAWWISVAEVLADLDPGELLRVLAET